VTTLYDVIRNLIRGGTPNTEDNQRIALLAVDAHEKGYADAESYQEELDRQAAAAAAQQAPQPGQTDAERARAAEARLAQLEAQMAALRSPKGVSAVSVPAESDAQRADRLQAELDALRSGQQNPAAASAPASVTPDAAADSA
jgi:hypothetical protein